MDPVIRVFYSLDLAVAYARHFVSVNARHKEDINEEDKPWALYYCSYSNEGDRVLVEEVTLNESR